MSVLFLTWQDPHDRRWYPVARLSFEDGQYTFMYTQGARASPRFVPFGRMTDLAARYRSPELFPLFANRILSKSRPDYEEHLAWMGLSEGNADPLVVLARTGGERATDTLQIYPCPMKTREGKYESYFFCHGIRYMKNSDAVARLKPGQRLLPMFDILNEHDPQAVVFRTDDPVTIIGYCPRYLTRDVHDLVCTAPDSFGLYVHKINHEAPIQFRLLCRLIADWPADFEPCSDEAFMPLASTNALAP